MHCLLALLPARECAQGGSSAATAAAAAAAAFWAELTAQSWRTELDHGLGGGSGAAAEELLVLVPSEAAVACLVQAAVAAPSSSDAGIRGGGIAVVAFQGWNEGQVQAPLTDWRQQLAPQLEHAAAVTGSAQ